MLLKSLFNVKPEKFGWDDVAQQIVGAFLLSAPFAVTEEVWELSQSLNIFRIIFLIFFTILISILIIYYTEFQKVAIERVGKTYIPKRLLSLLLISYLTSFFVLWMFGVIGNQIKDLKWSLKLVIFVSFFSSLGASTADILK